MRIFISYSSKDRTLVEILADDLSALGHTVWFDQELTGGHAWWVSILESVRQYDLFIFALTPYALDSHACKLEYNYADALKKRVLPVLLLETNTAFLPSTLSLLQFVDYRQPDKKASLALGRALIALPPVIPLPDPLPAAPEAPVSPMGKLKEQIEKSVLNFEEQASLVLELKDLLHDPLMFAGAIDLLRKMKDRSDTFAKVDREITAIVDTSAVNSVVPPLQQVSTPSSSDLPIKDAITRSSVSTAPSIHNKEERMPRFQRMKLPKIGIARARQDTSTPSDVVDTSSNLTWRQRLATKSMLISWLAVLLGMSIAFVFYTQHIDTYVISVLLCSTGAFAIKELSLANRIAKGRIAFLFVALGTVAVSFVVIYWGLSYLNLINYRGSGMPFFYPFSRPNNAFLGILVAVGGTIVGYTFFYDRIIFRMLITTACWAFCFGQALETEVLNSPIVVSAEIYSISAGHWVIYIVAALTVSSPAILFDRIFRSSFTKNDQA